MKSFFRVIVLVVVSFFLNCNKETDKNGRHLTISSNSINLELDSEFVVNSDTVILETEHFFQSNEKVFLDGSLHRVEIDDKNQIVIAVQRQGKLGIHVFNSEGNLEAVLGRYGKGPGEFEAISSMTISNDTLWVLDSRLQKISLFSLTSFKHLKDELIDKSLIMSEDKFIRLMKAKNLITISDSDILIGFEVFSLFQPNMFTKSVFYRVTSDGKILPHEVLNQDRYIMYNYPDKGNTRKFGFTAPFTRTSILTANQNGNIYTAWSEDFRIKKYNSDGEYIKEFIYHTNKSRLDLDNVKISKERKKHIEEQGMPDFWPALYAIEADDEGRLWVSTITDSDSTFKWFVIDEDNGDLIGSFTFQGKRSEINPFVGQPFFEIKNGFFYTREFNYDQGIDRINKYKIVFKERD